MRRAEMSNALTPGLAEVHRRCFPAVLFDLILDVLPFVERAQSCALDCGDMDEHVLAATLRLNESIALGRIEPLHRAARHCRSPIDDAQILFWICSLSAKRAAELCTSRFRCGPGTGEEKAMRVLALAFMLLLAHFAVASPQTVTPDTENGRYSFY